ncbi:hypothetical protein F5X99DRAFT_367173 [Biscogniauxia marginata]|nr:hypothetical protein F5X99DRAFT_367173 [Biscogniauxia marginata]
MRWNYFCRGSPNAVLHDYGFFTFRIDSQAAVDNCRCRPRRTTILIGEYDESRHDTLDLLASIGFGLANVFEFAIRMRHYRLLC